MRLSKSSGPLSVRVVAGTHVVLMALDLAEDARPGLRGFAIKRGLKGKPQQWLKGIKYFSDLVPSPTTGQEFSSRDQPFQSFLWSDYKAAAGTAYDFTIVALYGDLRSLEERHTLTFPITTEKENDGEHGIWFNRGAIASHAFEETFHNKRVTKEMSDNVSDDGKLLDEETRWLSRGLAEACLEYINDVKRGQGLRVCAYEFTYLPILRALKRAIERGVDVQIIYHDSKKEKDDNRAAIAEAELPETGAGGKPIIFKRTRTAIPHNKFIVKLEGDTPSRVWTGSTNFTDTGFFGQTNVGHLVTDKQLARTYLQYWSELKDDPVHSTAVDEATALTPNPPNVLAKDSISAFFSPRKAENMLDWYGQRIGDAASLAMMTIPFNVADQILAALSKTSDTMRLVILEDIPTAAVNDAEKRNRGKLAFSNGAILGKSFIKYKTSAGGAKVAPIPNSPLDKWFVDEELSRPTNHGHVFFVHSKVLLIDPLSSDPLICSGSANFSKNSLIANDENMLLIRGNERVADIYMTEIDRIFRHFRARDIINHTAASGSDRNPLLLDPTDQWITSNFKTGTYKNNRRLLFFPDAQSTAKPWPVAAVADPDPFGDEDARKTNARAAKRTKPPGAPAKKAKKIPSKGPSAVKKKAAAKKKTAAKRK